MLKFLKNLFAKQETPEEKVQLSALNEWLDTRTKPIFDDLNDKINAIIKKINNEKEKVNKNLKALENAQLQNPKIPERVKTIMQGNREGFINKISYFLNNLNFEYHNYNELINKCNNVNNEINNLGKSTAKNYQILNEFFAREAEKVAINIKNIENYSKELANTINNSKISDVDKIKSNAADLRNKIKLKESYSIQLENNNKHLDDSKNKKIEIENKINETKSSNDCKNYEKLLEEKEKIKLKINDVENSLFHDFSIMEKALKKYAKIAFENEKLILEYLENPAITLIKDAEFKIIKILDSLKNAIERNELELGEKKKSKAIEKINELDGVYFNKLKEDYKEAKKRFNDLNSKIENNQSRKNLDLLNEELKNINQNIENLNDKILNVNNELGKIDIGKLKEGLKEKIYDVANVKIILM